MIAKLTRLTRRLAAFGIAIASLASTALLAPAAHAQETTEAAPTPEELAASAGQTDLVIIGLLGLVAVMLLLGGASKLQKRLID